MWFCSSCRQAMIDEFDLDQDGEINLEVSKSQAECFCLMLTPTITQEFIAIMTDGE
jgi:hypothetical protein